MVRPYLQMMRHNEDKAAFAYIAIDTIPIAGNLYFKDLAIYIAAPCMGIAVILSIMQIFLHATHLSNKHEQIRYVRVKPSFNRSLYSS